MPGENQKRTFSSEVRSSEYNVETEEYSQDEILNEYLDNLSDPAVDAEVLLSMEFSQETLAALAQVIERGDSEKLQEAGNFSFE